jgi:hypothetical protein
MGSWRVARRHIKGRSGDLAAIAAPQPLLDHGHLARRVCKVRPGTKGTTKVRLSRGIGCGETSSTSSMRDPEMYREECPNQLDVLP